MIPISSFYVIITLVIEYYSLNTDSGGPPRTSFVQVKEKHLIFELLFGNVIVVVGQHLNISARPPSLV